MCRPAHLSENDFPGLPESRPFSRHRQVHSSAFVSEGFGILHHLSEFVHSKDNWRWSGAVGGSLRPLWTACTWSCTSGEVRSLCSITQGAQSTICLAGRTCSRMSRFTTVLLTWSSRAACSCVTQPSCLRNG